MMTAMPAPARPHEEGWAALRAGDAVLARRIFEAAHADGPSAETLEGLARVAYLELDFATAIGLWEQAYAAYRDDGDQLSSVRMARTLAGTYGPIVGDLAVCMGWLARAQTLLPDVATSSETGWVSLTKGMFEADRARKNELFREALAVGRRLDDRELEFDALAYLGSSLVHMDRTEEGMMFLDEALAAVAGSEVDDFFVLEEIFCQMFAACEHAHDVTRADQWIRVGESIAERRRLPAVSAFCRTHYGAVLTVAGRWPEAEAALVEAIRLWSIGHRSGLRAGALVRLADLRVHQGRYEEAQQLLEGFDPYADQEAARPLAAAYLAQGKVSLSLDIVKNALSRIDTLGSAAAPWLALQVDAFLAAGDVDGASSAAEALARCAAMHPNHEYLRAIAALSKGRVCLASATGDPLTCLREALTGFARAQMPMELARSRMELANALVTEDPEVALAEARSALAAFERLQAARDADAAAALLRSLGGRPAPGRRTEGLLTKREVEVLDLIGLGLSNPEISDRLYISRKTVEHHVGNVLTKLGLRSRTEAAAYAARLKPAQK